MMSHVRLSIRDQNRSDDDGLANSVCANNVSSQSEVMVGSVLGIYLGAGGAGGLVSPVSIATGDAGGGASGLVSTGLVGKSSWVYQSSKERRHTMSSLLRATRDS
jgi:hypothetical protein